MQSAGNLVSPAAEFTAGMQDRKYNLNRRNTGFLLNVYRNTAAVVLYRDRIILIYLYLSQKPASASSTALSTISYTR